MTLRHTEVPRELGGKGVGSTLARGVLEAARARGLKVVVQCDFVRAYMNKHPEFNDMLV
jgi:predicted GNAT family acetyltransferase